MATIRLVLSKDSNPAIVQMFKDCWDGMTDKEREKAPGIEIRD